MPNRKRKSKLKSSNKVPKIVNTTYDEEEHDCRSDEEDQMSVVMSSSCTHGQLGREASFSGCSVDNNRRQRGQSQFMSQPVCNSNYRHASSCEPQQAGKYTNPMPERRMINSPFKLQPMFQFDNAPKIVRNNVKPSSDTAVFFNSQEHRQSRGQKAAFQRLHDVEINLTGNSQMPGRHDTAWESGSSDHSPSRQANASNAAIFYKPQQQPHRSMRYEQPFDMYPRDRFSTRFQGPHPNVNAPQRPRYDEYNYFLGSPSPQPSERIPQFPHCLSTPWSAPMIGNPQLMQQHSRYREVASDGYCYATRVFYSRGTQTDDRRCSCCNN